MLGTAGRLWEGYPLDLMDQKIKHEELWGAEPNATEDELSDIIGSLSRLFSSTYYVNLEQDTYRAVIQLRRWGTCWATR